MSEGTQGAPRYLALAIWTLEAVVVACVFTIPAWQSSSAVARVRLGWAALLVAMVAAGVGSWLAWTWASWLARAIALYLAYLALAFLLPPMPSLVTVLMLGILGFNIWVIRHGLIDRSA